MSESKIITYNLAKLPSAHHSAGLAGLAMMVNWLKRIQPNHQGVCEIEIDTNKANFTIDKEGLRALLLEHFADGEKYKWHEKVKTITEKKSKKILEKYKSDEKYKSKFSDKSNQILEYISNKKIRPLEERIDPETNKRQYKYEDFSAKFSLIKDLDPTQEMLWLDLWHKFYQKLYKQSTTQAPFREYEPSCIFRLDLNEASTKSREKKIKDIWSQLDKNKEQELKGYKILGSAKHNAELIPFQDGGKTDFLLNFWIYVIQIYVPIYRKLEKKKYKPARAGYAIVIPDIVDLESFCEEFPEVLRESRGENQKAHYYFKSLPRQAIVNLAPAAGLDFLHALRKQLARKSRDLEDIVTAVEVYLVASDDKQYWIEDLARIYPDLGSENEFVRVRNYCRDDTFITQRLRNILDGNSWHYGFNNLCSSTKNIDLIFGQDSKFCHDARKSFNNEVTDLNQPPKQKQEDKNLLSLEAMIYKIVEIYVKKKLKQKYDLEWDKSWKSIKNEDGTNTSELKDKVNPYQEKINNYNEKKGKIALDAFYDCRSRSSIKFCEFFASTFGSVPQGFILNNQESYEKLAKALFEETDKVKSLTLLALAANS